MIDRIQNIENVGRITKTGGGQPQYQFSKNTHVYAGNTHGKSTLTAIIRSMQTNNPDFIKGRKTFDATQPQRAILVLNNTNYKFNGSTWDKHFEHIRIFDTRYMHENFFSPDEEITDDGQKKIETFILGSEGVRLAKQVVDLTAKQKENASEQASISREYGTNKPFDHPDFDTFLKVENIDNIDDLIDEQTKQLNAYKNQASIKSQLEAMIETVSQPEYVCIKDDLGTKLVIDVAKINEHIHKNMADNVDEIRAKDFLRSGSAVHKKDGSCPFCSQAIEDEDAKSLIKSYGEFFSTEYNKMADNRSKHASFFSTWSVVSILRKGVIELAKLDVEIDLRGADDRISALIEAFAIELESKRDFTYEIDFTKLKSLKLECDSLSKSLNDYLKEYDGDLTDKINETKNAIRDYEVVKKRYSEPWLTKSDRYISLKKANEDDITPQLDQAVNEQSNYANSVYTECMTTVNDCLEALNVDFKVQNLSYKGRSRNDLFSLVFNNTHEVGITTGSRSGTHTSRHTLSESDRRALCFAFFTASVISDPKCEELIIVLDDPVSSFDIDRRHNTAKYLKQLRGLDKTPEQMIILTHDKDFFKMVANEIRNDSTSLILEWDPAKSSSDFNTLDCNSHKLFMGDYYRRLSELQQYHSLSDSELNVGHLHNVRHILENIMKRKYYFILKEDIKDKKSVETFINTLSKTGNPYENRSDLAEEIRGLLPNETHHDQDNPGGYNIDGLGPADIRKIISDSLTIINKI